MLTELSYNRIDYTIKTNPNDPSGYGCIREIVLNDEYELSRFTNLTNTILDIGANCGVAATILGKQNPKARLFAFEPHPPTFDLLQENLLLNKVTNVTAINCAVGDPHRSKVTLFLHPAFSGGNTICSAPAPFAEYHNSPAASIDVPCVSLDSVIETHGIELIDLLKIDCEGSEFEILLTSESVRRGIVKSIVGEFHDLVYNSSVTHSSDELLEFCEKYIEGLKRISVLKL
jgi:FkbM family methyltransferase